MQEILNLQLTVQFGVTVTPGSTDATLTTQQQEVLRKLEAMLTSTTKGQ